MKWIDIYIYTHVNIIVSRFLSNLLSCTEVCLPGCSCKKATEHRVFWNRIAHSGQLRQCVLGISWNILRRNRDAEHTLGDIECLFAFCPANRLRNICAVFIHVFPKFYLENSWFWYVLHSVRTLRWSHQPDTIFEQHLKTAGHANPIITIAIRCVGAMVPFLSLLIDKPLPSCMEFMYRSCE